jgi:hypothetical protein
VPHSPVPDTQDRRIVTVRKIKRMLTGRTSIMTTRIIRRSPCTRAIFDRGADTERPGAAA